MAALDGKITIESGLRPCIVCVNEGLEIKARSETVTLIKPVFGKALFHIWNPLNGNALVEYEDGTIHEVNPTQIRFVDNAMSEYVFPEENESRGKSEDKWKPLKRVGYVCPKCGQGTMKLDEGIVLTSNPPQYQYQCDKCGYVKCSSSWIEASVLDNYG